MKRWIGAFALVLMLVTLGYGQGSGPITVKEVDGSPACNNCRTIIFPNSSLTVSGNQATVASGGGSGTVTSISVVTANGVSASCATCTTTPALTFVLGAITPTTVNGLTVTTTSSGVLTIANSKTLTVSNTLTFTGTDGSSVAFGAGGTVLYDGGALGTPSSGTVTNLTGTASININGTVGATTPTTGAFTTGTFSSTINQSSTSATAFRSGASSSLPSFQIDNSTASQASGLKVIGKADGTAPEILSLSRTQITTALAGNGLSITADPAIAGSSVAGAAAGGSITLTSGNAARNTSGNANGGNINLVLGTGIGTGTQGQALFNGGNSSSQTVVQLAASSLTTYGIRWGAGQAGNAVALVANGSAYAIADGNTGVLVTRNLCFGSNDSAAACDMRFTRIAAATLQYGTSDAASPVAQTTQVQNVVGGTTNTAGVTWTHQASLGTSQGAPGRHSFTAGAMIAASGTTQQTAVSRLELGATKVLTNNSATTLVNVTNASNTAAAGVIDYQVEVFDGTDVQTEVGSVSYMITNKGGAFSGNTVTKFGNAQNATSGTLTVTWAISAANPGVLSVNANSSLTPSTGYPRITYNVRSLSQQAIAVQ